MNFLNKRDFAITINGNHYFSCDYVFSNVYGDSVFTEEPRSLPDDIISASPESEALLETLPETHIDRLSSLPDCTKQIEYMTEGTVFEHDDNDIFIRYGSDESPMCVHIRNDGSVTLSGNESDVAEIVFEEGKRNFIALPVNLFEDAMPDETDMDLQSPLHLCVTTDEIKNNMTSSGGSLTVRYSIDVNGIVAEVSDFTITASNILRVGSERN
jgi:uncharacterized beta-barrel protein YwiB (DUF1934 family)